MKINKMDAILNSIAPCGLNCEKCFARSGGSIQTLSKELQSALGNFDVYAERFSELINEPIFKEYPAFKKMLAHFSEGSCQGCRNEQCKLFKQCGVRRCHQEKGIDFCFECKEFPCENTNFDPHLKTRWININERIIEVGLTEYYDEIKNIGRY